jgi:hypothetical protein
MKVKSNISIVLGGIGVVLILLVGLWFGIFVIQKIYRLYNPYLDYEISGYTTIRTEWTEISFANLIIPERPENEVIVEFESLYTPSRQDEGLLLPDGSILAPEIQVVDQQGNIFELNKVLGLGPQSFGRGMVDPETWKNKLPRDRSYKAIRIRSNKSVKATRIYWQSYSFEDMK